MASFYGGMPGQPFEIKEVYSSYYEMMHGNEEKNILPLAKDSSILPGEYVMVSYGQVGTDVYDSNKADDMEAGYGFRNSTLYQINLNIEWLREEIAKIFKDETLTAEQKNFKILELYKEREIVKLITSTAGEAATLEIKEVKILNPSETPKVIISEDSNSVHQTIQIALPKAWNINANATTTNATNGASVKVTENDTTKTFSFEIPEGVGIESIELIEPENGVNNESGASNEYKLQFNLNNGIPKTVAFNVVNGKNGNNIVGVHQTDPLPGTLSTIDFTFDDNTTQTIQIYNGSNGKGIDLIEYTSSKESGGENILSVTYGGQTKDFIILNGKDGTMTFNDLTDDQKAGLKGDPGVGIKEVVLVGNYNSDPEAKNTYDVKLSNGKSAGTFDVYNGASASASDLIVGQYTDEPGKVYSVKYINAKLDEKLGIEEGYLTLNQVTLQTEATDNKHAVRKTDLDSALATKLDNKGGTITGNLEIKGDLIVAGDSVESTLENVVTSDNTITLRKDAPLGLGDGDYTGIIAEKYDGTNNGMLVFDKDGTAHVGDEGDLQPLATRDTSENLKNANGHLMVWDTNANKLVDSGYSVDNINNNTMDLLWETGNQCTSCFTLDLDIKYAGKYNKYAVFCTMRKANNGDPVALAGIVHRDKVYNKIFISTGYNLASRSLWIESGSEEDSATFKFRECTLIDYEFGTVFTGYYDYCLPYRIYGIRDEGVDYSDVKPREDNGKYAITTNESNRVLSITKDKWAPLNSTTIDKLPKGYYIPNSAAWVDYNTPVREYDISFYSYNPYVAEEDSWTEIDANDPIGSHEESKLVQDTTLLWTFNSSAEFNTTHSTVSGPYVLTGDLSKYDYIDIEFASRSMNLTSHQEIINHNDNDDIYIFPTNVKITEDTVRGLGTARIYLNHMIENNDGSLTSLSPLTATISCGPTYKTVKLLLYKNMKGLQGALYFAPMEVSDASGSYWAKYRIAPVRAWGVKSPGRYSI